MREPVEAGKTYVVDQFPFVRREVELSPDEPDPQGPRRTMTWVPGVQHEFVSPDTGAPVCDGFGRMLLTVESVHKPGRFPARVFYTRQWEDPEGKRFGRMCCRIATEQKFRRLARGYGAGLFDEQPVLRRARAALQEGKT